MAYTAEISRAKPTCFFFLVDQSGSMSDPIMGVNGNPRKADFIADALNRVIQTLIVTASKDIDVRRYYQLGGLGYGQTIGSLFSVGSENQDLVWVDDLYKNPIRIEERIKTESDGAGGFNKVATKFPIWIDPVSNGGTPMCSAFEKTKIIIEKWVQEHLSSYPPTIINLTDGEANDGDPRIQAQELRNLSTQDGNLLIMTLHVSSNSFGSPIVCPSVDEDLPDSPSKVMFKMSSLLTDTMVAMAKNDYQYPLEKNAKAFVYNAGIEQIVSLLDIGTRPSNLR